ncbi:MAG: cell surface protein [Proteobacteria bacterium]|nr:cell surface protein [Pseudomonadota bacterium]
MRFCLLFIVFGCVKEEGEAPPNPFADAVFSFSPAADATYGQDKMPQVVLGGPEGGGETGSLDVVSLGDGGEIVLEFLDIELTDGEGPDLLVFENPFSGWYETGIVSASEDAETWHEWPCDPLDVESDYPGCAGVGLVWANSTNDIDSTDPESAGGDAFDLADIGLETAAYIKIVDSGANTYDSESSGFDLDAIAVVNGTIRNHGS